MYIVEIWCSVTRTSIGPNWFTGNDLSLADAMAEAKEWIKKTTEPDRYSVISRIVGCL